jgi:hypothetical protein
MPTNRWGPFSGRQLTVMFCALMVAVVMVPSAVYAVDAFSNVAVQDPVSGVKAKVASNGSLWVSDGSGAMTVDGTVNVRSVAPAKVWSRTYEAGVANQGAVPVAGPSATGIELTSLSVFHAVSGSTTAVVLGWLFVPSSATTCPTNVNLDGINYIGYVSDSTPLVVTFPTPIQLRPPVGKKVCLEDVTNSPGKVTTYELNASGYYD